MVARWVARLVAAQAFRGAILAKIQTNLLTDIQIRKWIRAGVPLAKSDGGGLTFTLSAAGAAVWVLRFSHAGRRQEVTLGRYPDISLAAARLMAAKKRLALVEGVMGVDVGLVLSPLALVFLTHFVFKFFEAGSKPICGGGFSGPTWGDYERHQGQRNTHARGWLYVKAPLN